MYGTKKGIVLRLSVLLGVFAGASGIGALRAEPTYLIYPNVPSMFRYDTSRYEVVVPGDNQHLQSYSLGNQVLWDKVELRVPFEIYRAPNLAGFEPSPSNENEFYVVRNEFNLIIDGFSTTPHTAGNLFVRFLPIPHNGTPQITIDSEPVTSLLVPLPPLIISTEIDDGYYSDTRRHHITWSGTSKMRIVVFSDRNGDGVLDGDHPIFSILVQDNVIATEEKSWGEIKSLYGER